MPHVEPRPFAGVRPAGLAAISASLHLALDGISWLVPGAAPPHLLLRHAPEAVQEVVGPLAAAIAASAVWGIVAVLVLAALEPGAGSPGRRTAILAAVLLGLWLFSEGLLALVWLDAPWGPVLGGLAAGLPRSLVLSSALVRLARRPRPGAPGGGGARRSATGGR